MSGPAGPPGGSAGPFGGPAGPLGGPALGPVPSAAGLCTACREARVVRNRRGSRFYLCGRSERDPDFPRYPPLPVVRCPGYLPGLGDEGEGPRGEEEGPGDEEEEP